MRGKDGQRPVVLPINMYEILPSELWIVICTHLSRVDLFFLSLTCRFFRDIYSNNIEILATPLSKDLQKDLISSGLNYVSSMLVLEGGVLLVSHSRDYSVFSWDCDTLNLIEKIPFLSDRLWEIHDYIMYASWGSSLCVIDFKSKEIKRMCILPECASHLAFGIIEGQPLVATRYGIYFPAKFDCENYCEFFRAEDGEVHSIVAQGMFSTCAHANGLEYDNFVVNEESGRNRINLRAALVYKEKIFACMPNHDLNILILTLDSTFEIINQIIIPEKIRELSVVKEKDGLIYVATKTGGVYVFNADKCELIKLFHIDRPIDSLVIYKDRMCIGSLNAIYVYWVFRVSKDDIVIRFANELSGFKYRIFNMVVDKDKLFVAQGEKVECHVILPAINERQTHWLNESGFFGSVRAEKKVSVCAVGISKR